MDPWVLWLIAAGLFAAGEVASLDLVLLMFAGGALGGMVVALLGGALVFQILAFVVVAALLLALVRPIASNHLRATPQQVDGAATLIGRTVQVSQPVDHLRGRIQLGADEWTARSSDPRDSFPVGAMVQILQVDGATAVVGSAPKPA